MPKRNVRHAKEAGIVKKSSHRRRHRDFVNPNVNQEPNKLPTATIATTSTTTIKQPQPPNFQTIHIGVANGKRWFGLKKRLGLSTDKDLAQYLLDLADSIIRNDNKCNGIEEWKTDRDKENGAEVVKEDILDDLEEPLRRSRRKQNVGSENSEKSPEESIPSNVGIEKSKEESEVINENVDSHLSHNSRSKHHRNKTKHHKDKRKKRKHPKNVEISEKIKHPNENLSTLEEKEKNELKNNDCIKNAVTEIDSENKNKLKLECLSSTARAVVSLTKTECLDKIDFLEDVNHEKEKSISLNENTSSDEVNRLSIGTESEKEIGNSTLSTKTSEQPSDNLVLANEKIDQLTNLQLIESVIETDSQNTLEPNEDRCLGSEENNSLVSNTLEEIVKNTEERKVKKKRKKPRHEPEGEENSTARESNEEFSEETIYKHRKKKHKHTGEHKIKKHHDVRKAPQDGIVSKEETSNINSISNHIEPVTSEQAETEQPVHENSITEPQRVAIKIKLCQECNSRHLQDTCPLNVPQYAVSDLISYEDWLNKYQDNAQVLKAMKTDDPMSEGYGIPPDDAIESDEESSSTEHNKLKTKVQKEETQITIDADRPLYARDSLPSCFELKIVNKEHGLGIYATTPVPIYAKLGPLMGDVIREMDIPDDFSMRHIWEIDNEGKTTYISTTNPLKSNWVRYMRPADTKEERSVAVITKQGKLYLVTTQNIVIGMELTYWADSQSSTWARKNKTDKTNCGGCNLNFSHPIYYRLHCCIFHDTNYSLTIRKYHCKVCGAAVLGKDNIMKHAAELHGGRGAYQCQYCKKFFLRLNYLEMHRTYGCAQNPQRSRPLCDFCGRKFCQPQKLKVHIKRMHSDMSEVLREFQCKLCLKLLGSRAALQRHMKEVHHKDVVGAATCDRCGKMFQNKSNLKIHMLTHSGVKPFKCKENSCKAAFTTKQCLQFHYKKVHGLTEELMPKIERSVAYTFDAYSGGIIEDNGQEKSPHLNRSSSQDNSNSLPSLDEYSSESLKMENSMNPNHAPMIEFEENVDSSFKYKLENSEILSNTSPPTSLPLTTVHPVQTPSVTNGIESTIENIRTDVDMYSTSRLQSKGSKKWLGEFNPQPLQSHLTSSSTIPDNNVYEFDDNKKDDDEPIPTPNTQTLMDTSKLGLSVYRRTESASLLVEAALDAAERDIGAVSSPILEDNDRDTNLYNISNQLPSPLSQRSPSHLDSYMQQQEELISPTPSSLDNRHSPPNHIRIDYHVHRPVEYINVPRTHSIDQYLHHDDLPRVSSPNNYIHMQQEDLVSPSTTPNPRYQDINHHQVPTDNLSSDEGDSVAQNLSLSVKEKGLQLDLSTTYKYDSLDQEFGRERSNLEPLVLNNVELQGLDMSARGFHHNFGNQIQNSRYHHHHHHHHLYDITERQSVDLSRTGGYFLSSSPPPPPPPPYPHGDVLRVVSLDLTPAVGRHSVDLSLSRSHLVHGTSTRVITSPQPPGSSTPHIVPDTIEGRILSPPPPPLAGYNPSYPVSPTPYHPPRPGYHYSGYY